MQAQFRRAAALALMALPILSLTACNAQPCKQDCQRSILVDEDQSVIIQPEIYWSERYDFGDEGMKRYVMERMAAALASPSHYERQAAVNCVDTIMNTDPSSITYQGLGAKEFVDLLLNGHHGKFYNTRAQILGDDMLVIPQLNVVLGREVVAGKKLIQEVPSWLSVSRITCYIGRRESDGTAIVWDAEPIESYETDSTVVPSHIRIAVDDITVFSEYEQSIFVRAVYQVEVPEIGTLNLERNYQLMVPNVEIVDD